VHSSGSALRPPIAFGTQSYSGNLGRASAPHAEKPAPTQAGNRRLGAPAQHDETPTVVRQPTTLGQRRPRVARRRAAAPETAVRQEMGLRDRVHRGVRQHEEQGKAENPTRASGGSRANRNRRQSRALPHERSTRIGSPHDARPLPSPTAAASKLRARLFFLFFSVFLLGRRSGPWHCVRTHSDSGRCRLQPLSAPSVSCWAVCWTIFFFFLVLCLFANRGSE